jgi:hypothetical protein
MQTYNWGTFTGISDFPISEIGFLFVGPSGSGKSTILDAHAALLTPPKWVDFNVAAREQELVCAIRGEVHDTDVFAACGLQHPRHRIRVRFLCPNLRKVVGGLEDVESPLEEIAALPLVPKAAIIVENLETGLAFPHLPGVVVLMELGVAVGVLNNVPWMQGIDALYWGDIDTHGYAILNTARRALPGLRSVLMDKETLFEYRKLWVEEPEQNDGLDLSLLTDCERIVYQGLHSQAWGNNVRLEQERIPWPEALAALEKGLWEHSMKLSIR